jgi:hypothetical protein
LTAYFGVTDAAAIGFSHITIPGAGLTVPNGNFAARAIRLRRNHAPAHTPEVSCPSTILAGLPSISQSAETREAVPPD